MADFSNSLDRRIEQPRAEQETECSLRGGEKDLGDRKYRQILPFSAGQEVQSCRLETSGGGRGIRTPDAKRGLRICGGGCSLRQTCLTRYSLVSGNFAGKCPDRTPRSAADNVEKSDNLVKTECSKQGI
jgi:hypothetical protein